MDLDKQLEHIKAKVKDAMNKSLGDALVPSAIASFQNIIVETIHKMLQEKGLNPQTGFEIEITQSAHNKLDVNIIPRDQFAQEIIIKYLEEQDE